MASRKRKRADEPVEVPPPKPVATAPSNTGSIPQKSPAQAMSMNLDEKSSPGWCAIDARLSETYPGANAVHFANPAPFPIGSHNPLNAVSAYYVSPVSKALASTPSKSRNIDKQILAEEDSFKHWHFVTYGFSELFLKSPTNSIEESGYGFELTFRIAEKEKKKKRPNTGNVAKPHLEASKEPFVADCPVWAVEFLQGLARYVFATDTKFDTGHYMALNGVLQFGVEPSQITSSTASTTSSMPNDKSSKTKKAATESHQASDTNNIVAVLFVEDPYLGTISTTNGRVRFLQVLGLTQDEYELIWQSSGNHVAELVSHSNPLYLTRLYRSSILANPSTLALAREYIETNGSSLSSLYNKQIAWRFADTTSLDPSLLTHMDVSTSSSSSHASSTISTTGVSSSSLLEVFIGAHVLPQFLAILKCRIPYNKTFICIGTAPESPCAIMFSLLPSDASSATTTGDPTSPPKSKRPKRNSPAPAPSSTPLVWSVSPTDQAIVNVQLSKSHVQEIVATLKPTVGQYRVGSIIFSVIPTFIRDASTSEPLRVIGQ